MNRLFVTIVPLFLLAAAWPGLAQPAALNVVATTTLIADVARSVGGGRVAVTALVPPDSDEHAWQPNPRDAALVASADLLLANGAGLELFLGGLLENAGAAPLVIVSNGVAVLPAYNPRAASPAAPLGVLGVDVACAEYGDAHDEHDDHDDHDEHAHGDCDPHVWTDPANVMIWADNIAAALAAADPAGAAVYAARAAAYKTDLAALDAEVEAILAAVPAERRMLVTNHNFLAYFARRYGFTITGVVLGETTLAESAPQQVAALVEALRAAQVPAIFAEVSAAAGLAQTVAAESGVAVVALYSGALSAPDGPAATYFDYLRYNARAIAGALGG